MFPDNLYAYMALRLSKALGRSPESWLTMQHNFDLWQARHSTNLSEVQKIYFETTEQTQDRTPLN